jgi:hypothetical protein
MEKKKDVFFKLRMVDQAELVSWKKAAGDSSLSDYVRGAVQDKMGGSTTEVGTQTAYDPGKGEVVVEPLNGVAGGKHRPYDPNGPEVTVEPIEGAEGPKHREYDPTAGEVVSVPVKGAKKADKDAGVPATGYVKPPTIYKRKHHPQCDCLMCKPPKSDKNTPAVKEKSITGKKTKSGWDFTGETGIFQGKTSYYIKGPEGQIRQTFESPED